MKKLLAILMMLVLISCKDDDATPTAPIDDSFDPIATGATLLKQGMLTGVGHTASGTVKIYDDAGRKIIVLDPFSSQNGPDLKVYLSKDESASQYVNLGSLKSTTGKQSYEITGMPDLNEYKFVLIWCEKFTVIFATSEPQ